MERAHRSVNLAIQRDVTDALGKIVRRVWPVHVDELLKMHAAAMVRQARLAELCEAARLPPPPNYLTSLGT
jgi:hypothetical protein